MRAAGMIIAAVLTLIAAAQRDPAAGSFPMTVVDDSGTAVRLEEPPLRIISIAPSNTEALFAIGVGDRVVAVSTHDNYPPEVGNLPRIGGYADVDVERIVALEPDLVVGSGYQANTAVVRLRGVGVTVFVVEPRSLDGVVESIRTLGRMAGVSRRAEAVADGLAARLGRVRDAVAGVPRRPRVFYELSGDLFTVGPGSYIQELIEQAGGINIAADTRHPYPQLSAEAVIKRDPEVIILGHHGSEDAIASLASRPGWAAITAVAEGRIVVVDEFDLVNRPGPRLVDGLEEFVRYLHPGLLEEGRQR